MRAFAFTVSTCSSSVRIIARASRSSSVSRAFSARSADASPSWIYSQPEATKSEGNQRTSCDACRDICLTGAGAGVGAGATSCTTMAGAGAAAGGGALVVFAGAGAAAGGSETGVAPEEIAPSSSETSFGGAVLPLKYLAADRAGSADGVGGRYRTGTSPTVGVE